MLQLTTFEIILQFIIGMTPTALLILFVIGIYFLGKSNNSKNVKKILQNLEEYFSPIATEFIEENKTASGFTYKLTLKRASEENPILKDIRQLRIHFSLEDRHQILTFLKLLFKSPKDYFIIEGDSTTKNNHLKIEIADVFSFNKYELEKIEKEWVDMVDYEPKSKFSAKFYHKTNHPRALKFLYDQQPDIKKYIYNLNGIFRVSVKRKTEWGFRVALVIDKKDDKQFLLAREIALRMIKGISDTNKAIMKQPKRFLS